MRSVEIQRLGELIQEHADDILALFKPGAAITVVVRHPGYPERDFVMTSDTFDGAIEALERSKKREAA